MPRPFRFPPATTLALAAVFAVALPSPARAAEPRDPVTGDPERFADFFSRGIALAPAALPEGWTLLDATTEGAESAVAEAALRAVAVDIGVASAEGFHVERRTVAAPDATQGVVLLVDLAAPAPDFVDALKAAGKPKGWFVREAGTARHLLVVVAPESIRERVVELQRAFALHLLIVAMNGALDRGQGFTAVGYGRIALSFEPKLAKAHYLVGITAKQLALGRKPLGDLSLSIRHLEQAVAADAARPLEGAERVSALGNLGQAFLNQGGKDAVARDLLAKAVADVAVVDRTWGIAFRYDLACAHGRLQELDAAFGLLEAVLADLAKEPVEGIEELWRKDPDFSNLKQDPRWQALLDRYPPK